MGNSGQNIQEDDVVEEDSNNDWENSTQEKTDVQSETQSTKVNTDNDNIGRACSKTPKRLKHAENSEERLKLLKKIAERRNNEEQDGTDLFFASMAQMVKKLPETEQIHLRLQIGTMVGNAQLRYLQQKDHSRSTSACSGTSSNYNPQNQASSSSSSRTPLPAFSPEYSTTMPLSPNDSEHFQNFYNM